MVTLSPRVAALRRVAPRSAQLTATGIGVAFCVALTLAFPATTPSGRHLLTAGRAVTAEIFLVAALACLARWWMTRRAEALKSAVGLGLLGLTLPVLSSVAPWASVAAHSSAHAGLWRVAALIPVFLVLALGHCGQITANRGTGRWGRWAVIPSVGVFAAGLVILVLTVAGSLASLMSQRTTGCVLELAAAVGWLALAIAPRRGRPDTIERWTAFAFLLMAASELARAADIAAMQPPGMASWLQLGAALALAYSGGSALRLTIRAHRARSDQVAQSLAAAQADLAALQSELREQRHEARSVAFGVMGACELLARPQPPTGLDRDALQRMIVAELEHLQSLFQPDAGTARESVDSVLVG